MPRPICLRENVYAAVLSGPHYGSSPSNCMSVLPSVPRGLENKKA